MSNYCLTIKKCGRIKMMSISEIGEMGDDFKRFYGK